MNVRDFTAGPRLGFAIVAGLLALALPAPGFGAALRGLVGWIVGVVVFLALTHLAIGKGSPDLIRARARALDDRAWVLSMLIVAAGTVSLVALGFVIGKANGPAAPRIALALVAVILSWLLVHTMFALHYAHTYYGDRDPGPDYNMRGGLEFPGHHDPDYWDFLYYAAVIGMTCQVSDVQVTSHAMRRITLAHGVLSFFFNTGVLALAVNIIAGAI
ncbi:MAG TPA: DUF1345 domain-containing protein [Stellaceae bacterium]|nr:DUF1345 domain-containing protein [Stellaceae bacterium]